MNVAISLLQDDEPLVPHGRREDAGAGAARALCIEVMEKSLEGGEHPILGTVGPRSRLSPKATAMGGVRLDRHEDRILDLCSQEGGEAIL